MASLSRLCPHDTNTTPHGVAVSALPTRHKHNPTRRRCLQSACTQNCRATTHRHSEYLGQDNKATHRNPHPRPDNRTLQWCAVRWGGNHKMLAPKTNDSQRVMINRNIIHATQRHPVTICMTGSCLWTTTKHDRKRNHSKYSCQQQHSYSKHHIHNGISVIMIKAIQAACQNSKSHELMIFNIKYPPKSICILNIH